jgi:hypothetical protein
MTAMNDATNQINTEKSVAVPAKPAVNQCVCRNGQIIVRNGVPGTEPPKALFVPMNLNGDQRLFIDKGKLVHPFVVIEFAFRRTIDVSGIDISLFHEVAVQEFDPKDMQPIALHNLEDIFNELNAPKA